MLRPAGTRSTSPRFPGETHKEKGPEIIRALVNGGALEEFRKNLAIAERLAAQDPDNAGWQSDLAGSHSLIGSALEAQGNLAGALEEFRKDLAIAERLAAQDPDNAGWQRGLSITYNRIGECWRRRETLLVDG